MYRPCHLTTPANRTIPNGKMTTKCFCLWWQNRHCFVKFWKCQRLCLFCLMMQKHCWNYFAFNQSCWRQNSSNSGFASWGKIKTHDFPWPDQGWIGLINFKNFADQDWIGFNFIGSGLNSDWKISQSSHLLLLAVLPTLRLSREFGVVLCGVASFFEDLRVACFCACFN